jgi:hypothetical protein
MAGKHHKNKAKKGLKAGMWVVSGYKDAGTGRTGGKVGEIEEKTLQTLKKAFIIKSFCGKLWFPQSADSGPVFLGGIETKGSLQESKLASPYLYAFFYLKAGQN